MSPFEIVPVIASYHLSVSRSLIYGHMIHQKHVATVVCLPSFSPEWAIRVCGAPESDYSVVLTETATSLWCCAKPTEVPVTIRERPICPKIAHSIEVIWIALLRDVRQPDDLAFGLDGETYHFSFSAPFHGFLAGMTWSPRSETPAGKLVTLTQALRDYVQADSQSSDGHTGLICELIEWFRLQGITGL